MYVIVKKKQIKIKIYIERKIVESLKESLKQLILLSALKKKKKKL